MVDQQVSTLETMVQDFAKANKVSKAKTLAFVENVINAMPKQSNYGAGRPLSNKAAETRAAIRAMRNKQTGTFTSVELAERLNTDVVAVNNSLRYLMQAEKIITPAGKAERTGKRGKRPLLWSFVN